MKKTDNNGMEEKVADMEIRLEDFQAFTFFFPTLHFYPLFLWCSYAFYSLWFTLVQFIIVYFWFDKLKNAERNVNEYIINVSIDISAVYLFTFNAITKSH